MIKDKKQKTKKRIRPRIKSKPVYSTCKYVDKLVKIYEDSSNKDV
jgi:hypothetical protein